MTVANSLLLIKRTSTEISTIGTPHQPPPNKTHIYWNQYNWDTSSTWSLLLGKKKSKKKCEKIHFQNSSVTEGSQIQSQFSLRLSSEIQDATVQWATKQHNDILTVNVGITVLQNLGPKKSSEMILINFLIFTINNVKAGTSLREDTLNDTYNWNSSDTLEILLLVPINNTLNLEFNIYWNKKYLVIYENYTEYYSSFWVFPTSIYWLFFFGGCWNPGTNQGPLLLWLPLFNIMLASRSWPKQEDKKEKQED